MKNNLYLKIVIMTLFVITGCTPNEIKKVKVLSVMQPDNNMKPVIVNYKPHKGEIVTENTSYIGGKIVGKQYQHSKINIVEKNDRLLCTIKTDNYSQLPHYVSLINLSFEMEKNGKVNDIDIIFLDNNERIIENSFLNDLKEIIFRLKDNFIAEMPTHEVKRGDKLSEYNFNNILNALSKDIDKKPIEIISDTDSVNFIVSGDTMISGKRHLVAEIPPDSVIKVMINNKFIFEASFEGYLFFNLDDGLLQKIVTDINLKYGFKNNRKRNKMLVKNITMYKERGTGE